GGPGLLRSVGGAGEAAFGGEHGLEVGLVGGLHVGFAGADLAGVVAALERRIHGDHTLGHRAFDDVANGGDVAGADGAAEGVVGQEDLVHGAAAAVFLFAEELGDDAAE